MAKHPAQSAKGFWYGVLEGTLRPILMATTKRDWRGAEQLHAPGGVVVAMNHLSWFDPLVAAHFCNDQGRPARFLAKAELFKVPLFGRILRGAGQIPVRRGSADAAQSLQAAVQAVNSGECVVVYPEGTLTRDPDLWPMTAKTGVARIALTTGCQVIPAAQWGPQEVLHPYHKSLRLFPRKTMHVWAGPAVNLDDLRGQPLTASILREATERIMKAITEILAQQRGQNAPVEPFVYRRQASAPQVKPPSGETA